MQRSKVFTRRGNDWTNRFKKIAADAWHINASSAIIDGEVVVPAANGTIDFSVLQNELKGRSKKIVLVAFDLLYLNGYDLRKLPLMERTALLKNSSRTPTFNSAKALRSTAGRCTSTPVKSGLRGSSQRSATAAIVYLDRMGNVASGRPKIILHHRCQPSWRPSG
jgi:hypothetical protein